MVTLGLVAEQVVDEEVARHAVELAVEVERALPAPDVQAGIGPNRLAAGELAAQGAKGYPLPSPLVPDGQLLGGNQEIRPHLYRRRRGDRQGQDNARKE